MYDMPLVSLPAEDVEATKVLCADAEARYLSAIVLPIIIQKGFVGETQRTKIGRPVVLAFALLA